MTQYRILTINQISPHGLHRFPSGRYAVGKSVEQPDAIIVRSADLHQLPIPASLKAIGRAGAGVNNIPVAEMSKRGIPVFNAPGANANAVQELVLTALLLAARNVVPALRYVQALDPKAPDLERQVEEGKKQFAGIELPHRTLGIIGLGAIGGVVADTAIKMGMRVTGFDPEITVDAAWRLPSSVRKAHSIEELLRVSDFVTLHVPLLPVTRHLIDAKRLENVKHGAVLLNFSRDRVVDEQAVIAALHARRCSPSRTLFRCRISARRPRKPRTTARRWSSIKSASSWSTARSTTRSTSRTSRCRASRSTESRSPMRTCRTCLARSARRWRTPA
jgi:D-3-phosphoglycerate dehydrogenase